MLLAGDFNASADSPELLWLKRDVGFRSATADDDPAKLLMTWDYQRNPNTHAFEDFVPVNEFEPSVMQTLNPIIVRQTKRLDYVFFRGFDGWFAPAAAGLFADQPYEGVMCSDHFGIEATFSQVP
jgi:endonuclease/exonuclease/phosphatase family metal-dependent hydrolase